MTDNINIIFYSEKCELDKTLLRILQNENLLKFFKLWCVDGRTNKLPPYITHVPTMIVSSENKPLVGKETLAWIEKVKFFRQQKIAEENKKIIVQTSAGQQDTSIKGFTNMEIGEFSDKFAYADPKVNISLPQTYFNIGDEKTNWIFTPPNTNAEKMNKDEQNKYIQDMTKAREKQDETYTQYMKKTQHDQYVKYTQESQNKFI